MADASKVGTPWHDDELDAIVADYFDMLGHDLAGLAYVKSQHSRALMATIGRTHRSVEFKHQNISAVLDELGLPWIPGYIPKRNYQIAIFDAIDRYLSSHPRVFVPELEPRILAQPTNTTFVQAPQLSAEGESRLPDRLRRLVRKFDPVERDFRNRSLGKAGEAFVIDVERRKLTDGNRPDLAEHVRWVSVEEGDGAGYDILSFDENGCQHLIEVKTTNGSARTPFYLSRNERDLSEERPVEWLIYRVHLFATDPRIFTLAPPLDKYLHLRAEMWRASF